MALSQQAKDIISELPLKDTLNQIRDRLGNVDIANPHQEDVASLLSALVGSPTAFSLLSPDGNDNQVRGGSVEPGHFCELVRHVEAVFDIIGKLSALTPPPSSIAPTFQGTPVRSSSSRLSDSETRDIVERKLFFEIRNCTFRDVGGFCNKFFNTKSWDERQKEMLEFVMAEHDGNRWKLFPTIPAERPVWDWLRLLEDSALSGAPHMLYTTKTAHQFKKRKGQMDFGIFDAFMMKLWVFDRSGAYSSGAFDIHDKPDTFARAFVSYATMGNDAIGLDTFIERENKHYYVTVDDINSNKTRIKLLKPIVRQNAIVCRGTTCYETQDNNVAKLAKTKGVREVAKVVAHRQITTIAELKKGLKFRKRHKFCNENVYFEDIRSVGTIDILSHKRKSAFDHRSNASEFKKLRSNSQQLTLVVRKQNSKQIISTDKPSLYNFNEDMWQNRIYFCLVISPAGRVISDFRTVNELLAAIRDAVKAHQLLYKTGNILHRDISSNNIIITKLDTADGFNGMLIDFDLAKIKDSGPSGARHQTGTMQFMAVEVLRKTDHIYRHDLESFFYVLLWMCARQSWRNGFAIGGEKPPKESIFRKWEIGTFDSIADAKEGHMTANSIKRIIGEFPRLLDIVKPLCLKIRKILFPLNKDEEMNFGTPAGDPDQLYSPYHRGV
ncbi:serine/threonine-protein kinase Sgk2 [Xylaria venustula]|nr:serine/threonine-protein kinase Sgk2 [Xylaria venustula]